MSHPIVEVMFGDFLGLCFDQRVNHAAKLPWLTGEPCPLVVRTPMGGGRGYGPTHSQSLEKHFCGVPGLTVLACHEYADPGALLKRACSLRSPVLFVENKAMYARRLVNPSSLYCIAPQTVIVCYGGTVCLAREAKDQLLDRSPAVLTKVVPIEHLSPFPCQYLEECIHYCRRVVVVEEGAGGWGFCEQVGVLCFGKSLACIRVQGPIPAARDQEAAALPSVEKIVNAVLEMTP